MRATVCDRGALLVIFLVAALAALSFRDYGLGWDDFTHAQYGELLLRYYASGFTDQRAVWAHYLHKGKPRKTVRLVRRIDNPCGSFSVRRRQIPVKRPGKGTWTLQVDQQKRYSRAPDSVFVRVTIQVFLPGA